MLERVQYILDDLQEIYRLHTNDSDEGFFDVVLSIVAWRLIDEPILNFRAAGQEKPSLPNNGPMFEAMMANLWRTGGAHIDKILQEWKDKEKGSPTIWEVESHRIGKIFPVAWKAMLDGLSRYVADLSGANGKDGILVLLEYLEILLNKNGKRDYFLTPKSLVAIMADYLRAGDPRSIYDPWAESGGLLAACAEISSIGHIRGTTRMRVFEKLMRLRLFLLNQFAEVHVDRFNPAVGFVKKTFDRILSNPPYGGRISDWLKIDIGEEWQEMVNKLNRVDAAFLVHILNSLSDDGQAAVLLPRFFLSGKRMSDLNYHILSKNFLDGVVLLPVGIFEGTGVAPVLFLFNKRRGDEQRIFLADATKEFSRQGKQVHLKVDNLARWIQKIKNRENTPEDNLQIVSVEEVIQKDCDLWPISYKAKKTVQRTRSEILFEECEQLTKRIAEANLRIAVLLSKH